jgi:Putative beta-barrel porin-2, OmpL-like. bbp2
VTPLMRALGLEDSPVKIYGWIQNSYTGNTNGKPPSGENFGVFPNHRANSWLGNQYYLIAEKPLDPGDEINFGFRVDNLFGHDWQFNKMYGLFDEAFNLNQFAGYDLAQAYGEAHLPLGERSLDVKFGRWYTLHGYEVVPATGRPLLSVPYLFTFGQPFTHVGALTTFNVSDKLKIYNGSTNGWDRWFNRRYNWGYIGGFNWTFGKDDKANLVVICSTGPNQFPINLPVNTTIFPTGIGPGNIRSGNDPNVGVGTNPGYSSNLRTQVTTVLTYKWSEKLTQVDEVDFSVEENVPGLAGDGGPNSNAEWYAFGNWFLYSFCEKLTGVWRSEVFRDDDGIRTGFSDNFYEMTLGLIYKPYPYLWIRPEARYDWAQFTSPYNDGTRDSQFTVAFDIILLY